MKTSLENVTLFHLCYFSIILSPSTSTQTANYTGTKLVGVAFKLRKRMKNSPSCVHVLNGTLDFVISRCCFAEDGREMYQNLKSTCRAIVFAQEAFCSVAMSLPLPSRFRRVPNIKKNENEQGLLGLSCVKDILERKHVHMRVVPVR